LIEAAVAAGNKPEHSGVPEFVVSGSSGMQKNREEFHSATFEKAFPLLMGCGNSYISTKHMRSYTM